MEPEPPPERRIFLSYESADQMLRLPHNWEFDQFNEEVASKFPDLQDSVSFRIGISDKRQPLIFSLLYKKYILDHGFTLWGP